MAGPLRVSVGTPPSQRTVRFWIVPAPAVVVVSARTACALLADGHAGGGAWTSSNLRGRSDIVLSASRQAVAHAGADEHEQTSRDGSHEPIIPVARKSGEAAFRRASSARSPPRSRGLRGDRQALQVVRNAVRGVVTTALAGRLRPSAGSAGWRFATTRLRRRARMRRRTTGGGAREGRYAWLR
jgi:hypothetical protein